MNQQLVLMVSNFWGKFHENQQKSLRIRKRLKGIDMLECIAKTTKLSWCFCCLPLSFAAVVVCLFFVLSDSKWP